MFWDIVFVRDSKNKLNEVINGKILKKLTEIIEKQKSYGFKVTLELDGLTKPKMTNGGYRTAVKCKVSEDVAKTPEMAEKRWEKILEVIKKKAATREWNIRDEADVSIGADGEIETQEVINGPFVVPGLTPEVMKEHFKGVHERDGQIRLIHDTVRTFAKSNGVIRGHTLLYGLPAGCKTTLFERFKGWYEQPDGAERVKFIDATTLSKAGLENWLISAADDGMLPDILVLEEIEKQSPDNLLCLLSVMGSGYVAKHNAKVQAKRQCNCLIWGTCNDATILKQFRAGALWSRFAHKWYCPRPSESVMKAILLEKIECVQGNPIWADKVMEFGWEKLRERDPRSLISLLDGGDRLLDNSYQKDILKIIEDKNQEEKGKDIKTEKEENSQVVVVEEVTGSNSLIL